jgi:hypothetical protein
MGTDTVPGRVPSDAPWVAMLDQLCDALNRAPAAIVPAIAATIRLTGAGGTALGLMRACAELERQHSLPLDVRHAPSSPGAAAYVVRIRRSPGG